MSTMPVNLKDVAAAAQELLAQLKRDAESMSDRLKRQGEESAQAVTGALAQLQEGLGETSDMMLAASHVFVQRFEMRGSNYPYAANAIPIRVDLEGSEHQRVTIVKTTVRPGKHKVVLFIIPEEG